MKLKSMYKTLARPAKKSKPQPLEEINLIKLHVVEEPEDKIFNCVDKQKTGCWFWLGAKDKYGYGQIRVDGKTIRTHRFAYEVYYGEFDQKLHVCHHCDQPACVNPDHLFLGTAKDNATDRAEKGRNGVSTNRLSLEQKSKIIKALNSGKSRREVAEEFGVHERTVGRIKAAYDATRYPTMDSQRYGLKTAVTGVKTPCSMDTASP